MNTFELITEPSSRDPNEMVERIEKIMPDGRRFSVPQDVRNVDYQEYLKSIQD